MRKMYVDNQWGYDVTKTNPFWIALYNLREVAKESVGEENVLDLSRGDPGYGFSPNVRSRQFYEYLLFIDTILNNFETHFVYSKKSYEEVKQDIDTQTKAQYSPEVAERNLKEFDYFMNEILRISESQGLGYSKRDVLFNLFKYASVSGGCYHDPQGEEICRAVVADWYRKQLGEQIHANDLIFIRGVSDGIGTFFQLMDDKEGIGYLKKGDTVVSVSPAYAPYNSIFKNRGLNVISISVDPTTGEPVDGALDEVKKFDGDIKVFVLIDPNNPTGFCTSESFKKEIAGIAKEKNAIILTDEVYFSFKSDMKSVYSYAKELTLRIDARSKIERSTGLRFGDYLIPEETNKYLTENILKGYLPEGQTLKQALLLAKAPGGTKGEFMHVSFVAGPSQFLGMCHIIFGDAERRKYIDMVQQNVDEFAKILGIRNKGNTYYTVFDLNEIANDDNKSLEAEEKFYRLAQKGVVLIPSYLFFSEKDNAEKDTKSSARACLPNLTFANITKAAKVIKEVLS